MKTINLGIIIEGDYIFSWQQQIIEKLFVSGQVDIVFLNITLHPKMESNAKLPRIYYLHEQLDLLLFQQKNNSLKRINFLSFLKSIPTTQIFKLVAFEIKNLSADKISSKLENDALDLIMNFSTKACGDFFTRVSTFGVLSYRLDGENLKNEYPSCYWEIVKKNPEIGASLVLTDNEGKELIVSRVSLSTYPNSIHVNRNRIFKLGILIIYRFIIGLDLKVNPISNNRIQNPDREVAEYSNKYTNLTYPRTSDAIKNIAILTYRFIVRNLLYKELGRWSVFYKFGDSNNSYNASFSSFTGLECRKGAFLADPFVITNFGKTYIFLEEFDYKKAKGHISVLSIDNKGNQGKIHAIIEKPYHMSYPFIFELSGTYYLIPETSANQTIELYRCHEFPFKWEFAMNIMQNINAKDSTLFFYNQKWWLFTSINETGDKDLNFNELFLFYTDDIFSSNWQAHPYNPIVTDPKLSRPAGKIFMEDGKIYRPSQDCSGTYGNAININQITKLDENEYCEISLSKILPDWDTKLKGLHTLNFDENITVIDVLKDRKYL